MPVFLLSRHGPGHVLNPSTVPYRANIFALKALGVTHVLATGAVGSLRNEIRPRDLVVLDQVIDKTSKRANTFFEQAAVHVEFADPFCPVLRKLLIETAKGVADLRAHERGTYVCMEGPAFSTRAESLMHRLWGGDVVGMTAMPEARLAREAELPYAMLALATDYDCWKTPTHAAGATPESLLGEIIGHLKQASENAMRVLKKAIETIATNEGVRSELGTCPALGALRLGIWSDKVRIPEAEVSRLAPLWGKYFSRTEQTEQQAGSESEAVPEAETRPQG